MEFSLGKIANQSMKQEMNEKRTLCIFKSFSDFVYVENSHITNNSFNTLVYKTE